MHSLVNQFMTISPDQLDNSVPDLFHQNHDAHRLTPRAKQ